MSNCIFCEIIAGKRSGDIVYKDADVIAIRDINPQAPVHILIIPIKHIATTNDLTPENAHLIADMFLAAKSIASHEGIEKKGYRLVLNCNQEAGQSVYHIHLHLLGGRWMRWPPG
ncbi:MAG: histidine triad nucleotide-binding protein [bacterium]